ncbi:MAG: hypothetical protein K9K82_12685 [Desulfobacteraceae bacterium]|nr:hypothetical protein [Desulfobacteraceae bacterium]
MKAYLEYAPESPHAVYVRDLARRSIERSLKIPYFSRDFKEKMYLWQ